MSAWKRWLIGFATLGVIAVAGIAVWLMTLDINAYRPSIEQAIEDATGRDVSISGPLRLKVSLPLAVAVNDVTFANAPWGSKPLMAELAHASAEVRIVPLLSGELQISDITIEGLDVLLETDSQGQGNWVFSDKEPGTDVKSKKGPEVPEKPEKQSSPAIPVVRSVLVQDVMVTYRDGKTLKETTAKIDALTLKSASRDDPIAIELAAMIKNVPVSAQAQLGSYQLLTQDTSPYPVSVILKGLGASLNLDGTISEPLKGRGANIKMSLTAERLDEISQFAGLAPPPASRAQVSARLQQHDDAYVIDDLDARIGRSDLTGALRVNLGGVRPELTGQFRSSVIDLSELVPHHESRSGQQEQENESVQDRGDGRLFPDDPLPFDALGAFDADMRAEVDRIILSSGQTLQGITIAAKNADRHLKVQTNIDDLMQGTLRSDVVIDAQKQNLSSDISVAGVEPGALLDGFGFSGTIEGGTLSGDMNFSGHGGSVRDILARSSGKVLIEASEARFHNQSFAFAGTDILKQVTDAINPFSSRDDITLVECAVVNTTIRNGVADVNPGLAVETDKMNVSGLGTIDLRTENLDLVIRAAAQQGLGVSVGGVASNFIRVGGTLSAPSVNVDPFNAVKDVARSGGDVMTSILSGKPKNLLGLLEDDNPSPCRRALGQDPKAESKPAQSGGKDAKDTLKDVGKRLKGLFGR